MARNTFIALLLLGTSGCYSYATVPSDAVAMAAAMCGGRATAKPHPRVYRDNRGRTRVTDGNVGDRRAFIVDHKTQMRWNNEWVHVCYSGYDVRQVPRHELRRPDLGRAVGVSIGLTLSAALIFVPIVLLTVL